MRPQRRRRAGAAREHVRRRAQRRVGVEHVTGEALEQVAPRPSRCRDGAAAPAPASRPASMARSNAVGSWCLSARSSTSLARRRDQRPERDARRRAGRHAHAAAQAEDRIEHGARRCSRAAGRPSPRSARGRRGRGRGSARGRSRTASAPDGLAFDDGEVRRPDLGLAGRARAGASRAARRPRRRTRSARTAWRTPDARRRRPAAPARARHRT